MKLFVFDVDGTLVTWNGKFRKRTINALNQILSHGDALAIASGRPLLGITQYLDKLIDGKKFAITANGAATFNYDGKLLDNCGMKFIDYKNFFNKYGYLIKERKASIYGYSLTDIIYSKMTKTTFMESVCNNWCKLRNVKKKPLKDEDPILKIMIAIESDQIKDITFEEEKEMFNAVDSSSYYHEFVNKKTDKSRGVEAVMKSLNLKPDDCYCFGDEMNDFQMIKKYHGVAMGNSNPKVLKVAKETTLDVKDDGVAYYLENYYKN